MSEECSWSLCCRSYGCREEALCPAPLNFRCCYSKKYWGCLCPQASPPKADKQTGWLIRLHGVYTLRWVNSGAKHFGCERQHCLNWVIQVHNTEKLMCYMGMSKDCFNLSLKMTHKKNTENTLKHTRVYYVPTDFWISASIAFTCVS